ncbi:MAG TPA: hypothetical protein VLK36_07970, partial [Gaiellaceae bacterium]|nr:hypothetical protein [Gaiellaceae bacterium]
TKVKYRRPYGTEWEELELDEAMEMIADRVLATREETWQAADDDDLLDELCDALPPRLEAPGELAIRAARSFDIPLSLSASYCFSFFTLARLFGIGTSFVASRTRARRA